MFQIPMKKTVAVPSIEESLAVVVAAVCSISLDLSKKSFSRALAVGRRILALLCLLFGLLW